MIVIVGAGVIGASVAWHLTVRGYRDVVLLDRSHRIGSGSTGRATGGFRAQYASAINIRLSLLAREKLRRFGEETGGDAGYVQAGYLWLASDERALALLRSALQLQHAEGLPEAIEVSPDEVRRLNPALELSGIVGGTFCPTDGFIRPLGILTGYLDAAARNGARLERGVEVQGLQRDRGGRVTGVVTTEGVRPADAVVNAGGAWAGSFARACDLDVPVTPLRRQVVPTAPTRALPESMPMTIFTRDGFHLRVRDGRVLLLWPTPDTSGSPFGTNVDAAWIDRVEALAHERVPPLRAVPLDRGSAWAGLYEMTPDSHPIVGAAPGCPNVYLASGCSGHGVMHAPAVGHLLAEIILDGKATTLDASPLRPGRFAEGRPNPVPELL